MEIIPGTIVYWHNAFFLSGGITIGIVEKKLKKNNYRIKSLFPETIISLMYGPRRKDFFLLSQIDSETWEMMKSNILCRIENLKKTLDFINNHRQ